MSAIFEYFVVDEITILTEYMHTHATGKRVVGEVFRDDKSVSKSVLDYWDFDQNGAPTARKDPFIMKKGDRYKASCYYESYKETKFGLGSAEEMCMVFVLYYPKIPFFACGSPNEASGVCKGVYSNSQLDDNSNFDRAMTDTTGTNDDSENEPADDSEDTSAGFKSSVKCSLANLALTMFAVLILSFRTEGH
jgi:hypothetical protein